MLTPEEFNQLLPLAVEWATRQEGYILKNGIELTVNQCNDAKIIPLAHPEKVRLLKVNEIPLPDNPALRIAAQKVGLITKDTIGQALQYGIFIRSDFWENRKIIIHELVHVSQYERLKGIEKFLKNYLQECVTIGYRQAPMEQEAILIANKLA